MQGLTVLAFGEVIGMQGTADCEIWHARLVQDGFRRHSSCKSTKILRLQPRWFSLTYRDN